eukprot:jgi/Botrbrau1/22281/Bobra.0138s0034.1
MWSRTIRHCCLTLLGVVVLWLWVAAITYKLPEVQSLPEFSSGSQYSWVEEEPRETVLSRIVDSSNDLYFRLLYKLGWKPPSKQYSFEVIDLAGPRKALPEHKLDNWHKRFNVHTRLDAAPGHLHLTARTRPQDFTDLFVLDV